MILTPSILRLAYANGFFPMPDPVTGELLWFNPDPRAIIPLDAFHVSRSLRRTLKHKSFEITTDRAFRDVMRACSERAETWITEEFIQVYGQLFDEGNAHSVEVWENGQLVGGTYGVALQGAFFAESKFHRVTDASKVALHGLVERLKAGGFTLLEVQFLTPHLQTLGAVNIPATEYKRRLTAALQVQTAWPRA